jgi:hypothetical protein
MNDIRIGTECERTRGAVEALALKISGRTPSEDLLPAFWLVQDSLFRFVDALSADETNAGAALTECWPEIRADLSAVMLSAEREDLFRNTGIQRACKRILRSAIELCRMSGSDDSADSRQVFEEILSAMSRSRALAATA